MKSNIPEKYIRAVQDLTMMEDIFMRKVLSDEACLKLVLSIILDKKDLVLIDIKIEEPYTNLLARSLILDVVAEDSGGTIYNIEIQNSPSGAIPRRARYHSSLIDANVLKKSAEFSSLPETYVIFITATDVLRGNKIIYHVRRMIEEKGEVFDDGSHIIYVNAAIKENTNLGRLMEDFTEKDYSRMHYRELAEKVKDVKEDEKEVEHMSSVMERFRTEGRLEGIEEGMLKGIEEGMLKGIEEGMLKGIEEGEDIATEKLVNNMYLEGISVNLIAKISGYDEDKVKSIIEKMH